MSDTTYKIVRCYQNHPSEVIETGLSLEEAKEHCQDPETSSLTCESFEGIQHTAEFGPWFDSFTAE